MKLREVKNKINATQNIYSLTQSLEMIAAMKVRNLKNSTLNSRPFVQKSIEILIRLLQYQKNLLEQDENNSKKENEFSTAITSKSNKVLAIIFASDRGFCGVYNRNILKYTETEIEKIRKNDKIEVELITIGKKTTRFFKGKNYRIIFDFPEIKEFEEKKNTDKLFKSLADFYQKGEYQKIIFFGIHYFTSFLQTPRAVQLFPFNEIILKEMLKEITNKEMPEEKIDYIFEPSFKDIFEELTYQLMEGEIYHAILEARTSEEASRMMAMKRAMDNAEDLIKKLTLEYNKARQAQITSEISEITSAKEAIQ